MEGAVNRDPWEILKVGGGLEEEENKENSQHEMWDEIQLMQKEWD